MLKVWTVLQAADGLAGELLKVGNATIFMSADFVDDGFFVDSGDFGEEIIGLLDVAIGIEAAGGD
jgi:hypothetical protein